MSGTAAPLNEGTTRAWSVPPILPAGLAPLVAEKRWLVWRWETSASGKPTKVPYQANRPAEKAASTRPATWGTYEAAAAAVARGEADGIGFALHGSEWSAFDLDDCRDRETHEIAEWAQRLIAQAGSYAEVTVSGEGVRIIGTATGAKVHRKQKVPNAGIGSLETYRRAERYIVVTGDTLDQAPDTLANLDSVIDETVAWLDAADRERKEAEHQAKADERRKTTSERASESARERGPRTDLPRHLEELIRLGPRAGQDRSSAFHHAVCWLKDYGYGVSQIEAILSAYPRGIAEKFIDRLRAEIERCYDKAMPPHDGDRQGGHEEPHSERKTNEAPKPIPLRWHGEADPNADRSWLIRNLVFETGKGLIAGQWGAGKTFGALDMSASVMTGEPFAGRTVVRTGGVLFIAPEGAFEIPIRLRGLVEGKLRETAASRAFEALGLEAPAIDLDNMPIAWIEECPQLTKAGAADTLIATAAFASRLMMERFGVPLALIVLDTIAAGAGFDDENSAAETQKVMDALQALSNGTRAFVMGVDHFGKVVETGTRGSSAKEAAADVVLAMLATRGEAGDISNTRMAVRKVRGARCGYEIPYRLDVVTLGEASDGEPITTCVVRWDAGETSAAAVKAVKERWPKSLKVFRDAMRNALAGTGASVRPFGIEGPEVRAVRQTDVRAEFMAAYPTDGDTPAQQAEARKKAFSRALRSAVDNGLIVTRDVSGLPHLWFAGEGQEGQDIHGDIRDTP